jgi:hypothetical protein
MCLLALDIEVDRIDKIHIESGNKLRSHLVKKILTVSSRENGTA